ncbi:hypothetical protein MtrunA17_Chr6g0485901 [Medicago truncatula]|uniref:Transmembrane protein n=1 Tax=Medicago truncatula TaxID=3880 RepID=A0A396HHW2_MEDTR|nr:hypothetical protein MtrunA17_Chr6g0485901 [Medicago truncatula]
MKPIIHSSITILVFQFHFLGFRFYFCSLFSASVFVLNNFFN